MEKILLFPVAGTAFLFLTICFDGQLQAQSKGASLQGLKVMFYNVENLFDVYDDPLTLDNDFLPGGSYHWTYSRFNKKINNIYKVIMAAGQWHVPDIIGLAEIENRYVLKKLVENTPLSKFNYAIVHENSPDIRGIDVALLYRPENFRLLHYRSHQIIFEKNRNIKTRDILHVEGIADEDTLHVFINHWPSRRGGTAASEHKRVFVAGILKGIIDSLYRAYQHPKIVITGDFNDDPDNKSIADILNAQHAESNQEENQLYNLSIAPCQEKLGTLKYHDEWNCFDQMIVSSALLDGKDWDIPAKQMEIFTGDFIFVDDDRYGGDKPFRTYIGRRYQGGFSDHLPVLIKLENMSAIKDE